jgi:uncharacterized protein (DUF736 family)
MEKSIGALWKRTSKNNKSFFSGSVELSGKEYEIIVFANNYKKTEKHPDLLIYESKKTAPPQASHPAFQDDIPF